MPLREMITLGIAMILSGGALLVAEAHVPSFGVLGLAGVVALAGGTGLALTAAGGGLPLAVALATLVAVAGGAALLAAGRRAAAVSRRPPLTGADALVGHVGVVRRPPDPLGQVLVHGALWRARRSLADEDEDRLGEGALVVIERVNGLTLAVRRAEEWEVEW
jgi:membrane-bound ClpP family serine protease